MTFPPIAFMAPGGGELLLILLVLVMLFGSKDAPRILRNIQNTLNRLQRAAADFRYNLMYGDLHAHPPEESKDMSAYEEAAKEDEESGDHEKPA